MIEKWTAQGSMAGFDGGHARPRVPAGGVLGWDQVINQRPEARDLARQWARYRYARRIFSPGLQTLVRPGNPIYTLEDAKYTYF